MPHIARKKTPATTRMISQLSSPNKIFFMLWMWTWLQMMSEGSGASLMKILFWSQARSLGSIALALPLFR